MWRGNISRVCEEKSISVAAAGMTFDR